MLVGGGGVASLALLGGCGRRATREDCTLLVEREIELQIKANGTKDPALFATKKAELMTAMAGEIEACIGKRGVSDARMECVRTAETSEKIAKCVK